MGGISKAIGIGAGVLSIYSIAKTSSLIGLAEAKKMEGEHLTDTFIKENAGDADVVKEGVKKWYWNYLLDDKMLETYYKIKAVATETVKQAGKYVLPLGLAAGAWFGGVASPVFAGLLVLMAGRFFVGEVMGIGKKE